ncbi:MAG: hypothetical protein ACREIV_08475, partial [Planctomycetaceae bacterium]
MRSDNELTTWIGYSDFLTTLAIVFFVMAVAFAQTLANGTAHLAGIVDATGPGTPVAECLVQLGPGRQARTTADGRFDFSVEGLSGKLDFYVDVTCAGYGQRRDSVALHPGDTTALNVVLRPGGVVQPGEDVIVIRTMEGDAAFERNDFRLTAAGIEQIREIGLQYVAHRRPADLLVIQGHTDDMAFPLGAG